MAERTEVMVVAINEKNMGFSIAISKKSITFAGG